jgi:hypothetical protein
MHCYVGQRNLAAAEFPLPPPPGLGTGTRQPAIQPVLKYSQTAAELTLRCSLTLIPRNWPASSGSTIHVPFVIPQKVPLCLRKKALESIGSGCRNRYKHRNHVLTRSPDGGTIVRIGTMRPAPSSVMPFPWSHSPQQSLVRIGSGWRRCSAASSLFPSPGGSRQPLNRQTR